MYGDKQDTIFGVKSTPYYLQCMYIPEVHSITGKDYHEREDFAYVLKLFFNKYNYALFHNNTSRGWLNVQDFEDPTG